MRRFALPLSIALLAAVAFSSAAPADVVVRAAVRPDSVQQCGPAKAFVAIANTGERPIRIRASLSLVNDLDSVVLGPYVGKLHLAAGERRMREFRFMIPNTLPSADYRWIMHALANDLTRDSALAPFVVTSGGCPASPDETDRINDEKTILESLGLEPDDTTDTRDKSWGEIKKRYRD